MTNTVCWIFGHDYDIKPHEHFAHTFEARCTRKNCGMVLSRRESEERFRDIVKDKKYNNTFWDSDAWDYTKIILLIVGLIVLILLCGLVPTVITTKSACTVYAQQGIEVMYNFWTGCMANHPDFGWMPVDEYFNTLNVRIP